MFDSYDVEVSFVEASIETTQKVWGTVNNLVFDPSVEELQDHQQRQVAALRSFYSEESSLPIIDQEWLFEDEVTEIRVHDGNVDEICDWLRDVKTWIGFKPAVVEDESGLVLVY